MISVIVPVYNVEKYLKRCVDSILAQDYEDYEVILVDDGSTDQSGNICDAYAKNHKNVKVIHKENAGPSGARNVGIKEADGDFVTFIDSDDYISNRYLFVLDSLIKRYNADLACARFESVGDSDDLNKLEQKARKKQSNERIYYGRKACKALLYEKDFQTSSCNILLKTKIAEENLFPIGKYHEDELTTFRYMLSANKVVITDEILYFYYQREGSIMHTFGKPVIDEINAAENYVVVCRGLNSRTLLNAAYHKKYDLIRQTLVNYPELKENYPDYYNNAKKYLLDKSIKILFGFNSSMSNRKFAIKLLVKHIQI